MRQLLPLLPLILGACTTVPAQRLQGNIAQTISIRADRQVDWQRGAPEEEAVRDAVRRMLADELTLDEAVAIALINNRELRSQLARAQVARADLVQAGLLANPVFGISWLRGPDGTETELSVFEDFLNVFTLSARRRLAGAELDRVRLEVAHSALDLIAEVKRTWYALAADRQAIELFAQVTDSTQAAADLARRQYQAGTVSLREHALQQAFYAQASLEAARAQAAYSADREKLNRLLSLWGEDTGWRLLANLPEVPDTVPASAGLESKAVGDRLDLAARRLEVEATHAALGYTRQTRWLSALGIGFTVKREPDGTTSRGPQLKLGLPAFDFGQARIAGLEAQLQDAENRYAQEAIGIRAEVREASARVAAARDAVQHYRQAILPLTDQVLEETLKFYNGMLLGVYDLLLAKQNQINAARDYLASWREFWLAWADLERATGSTLTGAAVNSSNKSSPASTSKQSGDLESHQHGED